MYYIFFKHRHLSNLFKIIKSNWLCQGSYQYTSSSLQCSYCAGLINNLIHEWPLKRLALYDNCTTFTAGNTTVQRFIYLCHISTHLIASLLFCWCQAKSCWRNLIHMSFESVSSYVTYVCHIIHHLFKKYY